MLLQITADPRTASPLGPTVTVKTSVDRRIAWFGSLSLPETQAKPVAQGLCLLGYAVRVFLLGCIVTD